MLKRGDTEEWMAAASRTALATPTCDKAQGQTPEGPESPVSANGKETSQTEATKAFWNKKASAEEGKASPYRSEQPMKTLNMKSE